MDFEALRKRMVEEQLCARGIKNKRVIDAFYKVERHRFVPVEFRDTSYADFPVPIGNSQTISQPYIVALMTECLGLEGCEKVLEVGTGSGYQTAILAEVAQQVCTIERFIGLSAQAKKVLTELGYSNISLRVGDGTLGWPEEAPFDRIIITAASPRIPLPISDQLKEGGRLVLPLGESFSQVLTVAEKTNNTLHTTDICGCVFVPLVGKYGWRNNNA